MADRPVPLGDAGLRGRGAECALLDALMAAVRTGESRTACARGGRSLHDDAWSTGESGLAGADRRLERS
jgi:hypothetical protein